jgi:hypothetical protein
MTEKTVDEIAAEIGFQFRAPKISLDMIKSMIMKEEYFHFPDSTKTVCDLTLYNGFRVLGEASCASPVNFNDEIGRRMAREDALRRIWPFAGFWLCQVLWQNKELYDPTTVQFWVGPLPSPSDPIVNPAITHIDAARDVHLMDASVSTDAAEIEAVLAVTTQSLADAGLLNPDEAEKIKSGLAFLYQPPKTAPQNSITVDFPVKEPFK